MPSLFPDPSSPSEPWIVAHCDGGARGNPGPAGYGAIVQTETGEKLAELSEFIGNRTNNVAEYSGLLGVLAWTLEHGHGRLRVISDSELMVKQIQGRYKVNSPDLKPLWAEARSRIARLDGFQITHALRNKNKEADRLANLAMDRGMGRAPSASSPSVSPSPSPARQPARPPAPAQPSTPSPARPAATPPSVPVPSVPVPSAPPPSMLRGFTRDGVVHLLGGAKLPDGIFVKVVPE
ncbi:MAG TPA: ribonuclease HI family protein [Acidobacteriaceae bacterium]|nr:ribonuclease HI family protein [Acidobacteriaceae bacterium]